MYQPIDRELRKVCASLSSPRWRQRVAKARALEKTLEAILRHIEQGQSQEEAIRSETKPSQRSKMLRLLQRYRADGFEGLIDRRTPREHKVTKEERDVIKASRMANPSIKVEEIQGVLQRTFSRAPSATTIKRVLHEADLQRPVGRPAQRSDVLVEALGAAGLELIRAAEAETGAVGEMVRAVVAVARQLPEPTTGAEAEQQLRNQRGQFTKRYNRSRRKQPGQAVAPAYRTAAEKTEDKDLGRLSFRTQRKETIEAKLWALLATPVLTLGNRIEELYGPRGKYLEGICGYAYMPDTLRKTASEWTLAGLGYVLQQVHAASWHRVSVERWEQGYQAAVVYIDNTTKPLWTRMFTKSAKVAMTGRVQPALVSTFVQTGVGVPIYFETHSGPAPLAPRVLSLLEQIERSAEYPLGRLTVIDGECCSASLLREFKDAHRDLVTPLPATLATPERIRFERGSAPQPYREGDTIREGQITLVDSHDKGRQVEARAIVIEQRTKAGWVALVTLADRDVWPARRLAEIYYERWPRQENFFRLANEAVGLNQVHGYGKRLVTNTSVLTKLDELEQKAARASEEQASKEQRWEDLAVQQVSLSTQQASQSRYQAKRQERVDAALASGKTSTVAFRRAVAELRESSDQLAESDRALSGLGLEQHKLTAQLEKLSRRIERGAKERAKLEDRKEILEADVAQDVLFSTLKLTLAMLVHFVVVEYFPHRPMEWATFLSRLALLPGRRETTETMVTTFIEANDRDTELMMALENACVRINRRRLTYKDRRLRFVVEWPELARGGGK